MSSAAYTTEEPSSVQTRRLPMRTAELENGSQMANNRRSLSDKFRDLFRKSSSSPSRSVSRGEGQYPSTSVRQPSPSPQRTQVATVAPHLRPPLIQWPFGKKKSKATITTSKEKSKRKHSKTMLPPMQISSPIRKEEYQTGIHGENFTPRTPELIHGSTGRTRSSPSYETNTKGFRDFIVIDHTKSSQQPILQNYDMTTSSTYDNERSRSPSLNQETPTEANIERSSYYDTRTPISDIEFIPMPKQTQYYQEEKSPLTTTQSLIESIPIIHSTLPQKYDVNLKTTSNSSLSHTELRSTTSSSMNIDNPEFNAPVISSTEQNSKQRYSQAYDNNTYHSSSIVNQLIQKNSTKTNTYNSLPNIQAENNESFTPIKPIISDQNPYPTLSAIVAHHMGPIASTKVNQNPSSTKKNALRFETSTTTSNDYDRQPNQPWSRLQINSSSSSIPAHDGFIRPLTPSNDQTIINDIPNQPPVTYRSSTIIYTRDKHHSTNGELRTWSMQDHDHSSKPSTSIQILPSRIIHEYQYQIGKEELENLPSISEQQRLNAQYTFHRHPDPRNSSHHHHHHFSSNNEREQIINQSTRSNYTQESFNSIIHRKDSEATLRHYTLQHTDSYDGLGIVISADANTHLNHRIRDIETDSPGSRLGLRINDRIININGINVENMDFNDVLHLIKQGLNNNNLQISVQNE